MSTELYRQWEGWEAFFHQLFYHCLMLLVTMQLVLWHCHEVALASLILVVWMYYQDKQKNQQLLDQKVATNQN